MTAIDQPGLARFWTATAERLERNGLRPAGSIRLDGLDRAERHAMAGLLGRPIATDRVTVHLADLDRRLRASGIASGLVEATRQRCGPLVDRPGVRQARADASARVWSAGRDALDAAGLSTAPWVEAWFEDMRRSGALARVPTERAIRAIGDAVRCVGLFPSATAAAPCGRGELASLVTGDAHGLDDGTLLAALTLRAAALAAGCEYPLTPAARRDLWRQVGVLTDEVSTTVLTAGLRGGGESWLDDRTSAGWESHLTARDLRRIDVQTGRGGLVHLCENPRVLEAAIDGGMRAAIVCTMGNPTVVVTALVHHLSVGGAELRYHGDFDWPGIGIANALIGIHGCQPWRFEALDYLDALAKLAGLVPELPALGEASVQACWDESLGAQMAAAGRAVHEELVLSDLLADLGAA